MKIIRPKQNTPIKAHIEVMEYEPPHMLKLLINPGHFAFALKSHFAEIKARLPTTKVLKYLKTGIGIADRENLPLHIIECILLQHS